jgi:hypothetical protein
MKVRHLVPASLLVGVFLAGCAKTMHREVIPLSRSIPGVETCTFSPLGRTVPVMLP